MIDRESRDKLAARLQRLLIEPNADITELVELKGLSKDAAICGVSDRLDVFFVQSCENHSCGFLSSAFDCAKYLRFGRNGDGSDSLFRKRVMGQAIDFLMTDKEYEWKNHDFEFAWWMLLPLLIALFMSVYVSRLGHFGLIGLMAFVWLVLVLFERLSDKLNNKDRRYWPFKNRQEYESSTGTGD